MSVDRESTHGPGSRAVKQDAARAVGAPWFVQFWPLFLVFLMVASITGSLATVVIAYRHADEDVRPSEALEAGRR